MLSSVLNSERAIQVNIAPVHRRVSRATASILPLSDDNNHFLLDNTTFMLYTYIKGLRVPISSLKISDSRLRRLRRVY